MQVAYFPRTVLTGAIGAIGVSLFVLGLELSLPASSGPLTLKSAWLVLFNRSHLGIFLASVLPAVFLSLSTHSTLIERLSRGATQHALYVPAYLLITAAAFWVAVAALGLANEEGMQMLARRGWLFMIEESAQNPQDIGRAWMYWKLFDWDKVEWHAMKGAVVDIVLLVVIGVLNLPLFIPMLAFALDVPSYDMDHEFLGHGVANILAGVVGTLPNLVVCLTSRMYGIVDRHRSHRFSPTRFSSLVPAADDSRRHWSSFSHLCSFSCPRSCYPISPRFSLAHWSFFWVSS